MFLFAQLQGQVRRVFLEHANTISFDRKIDEERQTLRGEVLFRQDSVWMSCDSAYFYQSRNSFEAFSNVHMWEGDTLQMWCDSLSYDGNQMMGRLYDRVTLRHFDTELHTDYLTYDRQRQEAHFPYSGWAVVSQNHLFSEVGWYYPATRLASFVDNVEMRSYDFSQLPESQRPAYPVSSSLIGRYAPSMQGRQTLSYELAEPYHPEAILYSDSLCYCFDASEASVYGPSRIENDSMTLFTDFGVVNTQLQQSWLYLHNSAVSPGRFSKADTLFYDGVEEYGDAWGHFLAYDSVQHMAITGQRAHYTRQPQVITVTDQALAREFSSADTLFMHADTIRAFTTCFDRSQRVPTDSLRLCDTLQTYHDTLLVDSLVIRMVPQWRDSAYVDTVHFVTCHFNVRYYRSDLQGVCDSLNYNRHDSLATFIGNPVMWNEHYQITGDTIFAYMAPGQGIDRVLIHDNAFLTQQHDSIHFDQISGKTLVCLFDSARIKQMDMAGNVQIIFYSEEGKGEEAYITLHHQVVGSYLTIWFRNQKMDHLRVWPEPIASTRPLSLLTDDLLRLEGFRWMDYLRPLFPADVFRDVRMKAEDQVEILRLFNEAELNGW